jgi:hypothetical protein
MRLDPATSRRASSSLGFAAARFDALLAAGRTQRDEKGPGFVLVHVLAAQLVLDVSARIRRSSGSRPSSAPPSSARCSRALSTRPRRPWCSRSRATPRPSRRPAAGR